MEQINNTADDADERIPRVKKQADELKAHGGGQNTPWYKNASTLISLLALLLSFISTYFGYTRAEAQNIQTTRTELRAVLQRLSSLPREYQEGVNKNRGDQNAEEAIRATISQENSLLSNQAAELVRKLPRNNVSTTEWYTIAMGLRYDRKDDEAKEFLGYALQSAKGFTEKLNVLRGTADFHFTTGRPFDGRIAYQTALGIFSEFSGYDKRTQSETQIHTHLSWASSAEFAGLPEEVNEQITKAESYVKDLPQDRRTEEVKAEIEKARRHLILRTMPPVQVANNNRVNNPSRPLATAKPRQRRVTNHMTSRRKKGVKSRSPSRRRNVVMRRRHHGH